MIRKGLENVIASMNRSMVQSADVMLMVQGRMISDSGRDLRRHVIQVVGSCFNPVVFDFVRCGWGRAAHEREEPLTLPCRVYVEERMSRVSEKFKV
eukprot:7472110-Pyramimonas_sp.AAC.1